MKIQIQTFLIIVQSILIMIYLVGGGIIIYYLPNSPIQEPTIYQNLIYDKPIPQGWLSAGRELSDLIKKISETTNKVDIILDKDIEPTMHSVNEIVDRLNKQGYVDIRITLPKSSTPLPVPPKPNPAPTPEPKPIW